MVGSVSWGMRSCQWAMRTRAIVAAPVTLALDRRTVARAVPAPGSRVRIAFAGQRTFFEACALADGLAGARTIFLEFRKGGDADRLRAALDEFRPHVVI